MPRKTVFQRPNDPYIYLYVMGEWYCYDPASAPLGSGAMGTVYVGYWVKTGDKIAVKRVIDQYANNKMIRERAKLEASLAFRHQNLVEMLGYCEYAPDNGPIFILSKFVSGENIDHYVKKLNDTPDRIDRICDIIGQVLDALEYIHFRGVIHRDIKPSNIMIEHETNVRLMDLGIARMNSGNNFSSFGFIGTPQYSAPEQIVRDKEGATPINAATDIYALGITFYELLTGTNPFNCQSDAETLTKQMRDPLPNDSKIPKRLMQVLLKATEKEQSRRYQTAADFHNAIKTAMVQPKSIWERIGDWITEHL